MERKIGISRQHESGYRWYDFLTQKPHPRAVFYLLEPPSAALRSNQLHTLIMVSRELNGRSMISHERNPNAVQLIPCFLCLCSGTLHTTLIFPMRRIMLARIAILNIYICYHGTTNLASHRGALLHMLVKASRNDVSRHGWIYAIYIQDINFLYHPSTIP